MNGIRELIGKELRKDYYDKDIDKSSYFDSDFKDFKKQIIITYLKTIRRRLRNYEMYSEELENIELIDRCVKQIREELQVSEEINDVIEYYTTSLMGIHCSNYNHGIPAVIALKELTLKIVGIIENELKQQEEN
jgi:tRNA isopentenyl-2-thiomethyl-A-37 hydroxylase MiaE